MRLEELSIAVRERNLAEVFDLGLLLTRRYWRQFLIVWAVAGIPLAVVNWLLFDLFGGQPVWQDARWLLATPVLLIEAPLLTAAMTCYLGQAMFAARPSLAQAGRDAVKALPTCIGLGFLRLLLIFHPRQLQEVMLLEQPAGFGAGWKRAWRLSRFYFGENIAGVIIQLLVWTAMLFGLGAAIDQIASILQMPIDHNNSSYGIYDTIFFWPWLAINALIIQAAVFAFAAYIDLRCRREGWEVELGLRQAGERLGAGVGR